MSEPCHRKKLQHYNTPGHAHELTFSCYRRQCFFDHSAACRILLDEIDRSRTIYKFNLWAYVIMPHHVHLLIWPLNHQYDIGRIESGIKGVMAKRYRKYLSENHPDKLDSLLISMGIEQRFIFWQKGGGFDRNLWNAKAIHAAIRYIEDNPVRAGLVASSEEWQWSSAWARSQTKGVIPDIFAMPVALPDPQYQRFGVL
jgi:putative transposase